MNGFYEEKIKLKFTSLNYSSLDLETIKKDKNFLNSQEKLRSKFKQFQEEKMKGNEKVEIYFLILNSFNDVKHAILKNKSIEIERLESYEKTIFSIFKSIYDRLLNESSFKLNILNDVQNLDDKMKYGIDKILLQTMDEIAIEYANVKKYIFSKSLINLSYYYIKIKL